LFYQNQLLYLISNSHQNKNTMKKLIIPILFLVILSSCATQKDYIIKTDGTTMSKRQFDRWSKKNSRMAWKSLNKEEKDLLKDTKVKFTYGEQNK
jgi:hypothetical protein